MLNLIQILDEAAAIDCPAEMRTLVIFIKALLQIVQIGIPIILIVMGSIDLGKAVLSSDDKEIKGATGKLIKRAIAAIAVFFVATIVSLLMGLFGKTDVEGKTAWQSCWNAEG